jgi:hypothetical protein
MSDLQGTAKPANLWAQLMAWKASLIVLADVPALVKWIKYTDTEVSEAGNVRVMLKDKQNLQQRLNALLYWPASTINEAFHAISWAHRLAGLAVPCKSDIVKTIREGSIRSVGRCIIKKEPIILEI